MGSDGEPLSPEMLPATVYRDIMAWAARMEASWKSFVEAKNDVDETAEKRWLAQDNLIETVHKHALAVQEQMEVVRDQVMAVREEVGATRAALKQFEASQENFRALVFQKFDRLQGTIDLIKEDINVNFASSNTALTTHVQCAATKTI